LQVNLVAAVCEILGRVGNKDCLTLLQKVVDEAPPADKSVVKGKADAAVNAIKQRG
jgi:hypothetical protein